MNRADMIATLKRVAEHCAREDWKAALAELDSAPDARVKAGETVPDAAMDCVDSLRGVLVAKLAEGTRASPMAWIDAALQNIGSPDPRLWPVSDADIAALLKAARRRAQCERDDLGRALAERLNEIASAFLSEHFVQQGPSPSEVTKRLRSILARAEKLLAVMPKKTARDRVGFEVAQRLAAIAAVRDSKAGVENPVPGDVRLRAAVSAVADLAVWCEAAAEREEWNVGKSPGNRGDIASRRLHGDLAGVWLDFWKEIPGASRSDYSGKVGGPYIRFVAAFFAMLRGKISGMDWALDPELMAALTVTPNAIRERLRDLNLGNFRAVVKSKSQEI